MLNSVNPDEWTLCVGFWLSQLPFSGAKIKFDITFPDSYPFKDYDKSELKSLIKKLRIKSVNDFFGPISYVDTSTWEKRRDFQDLVYFVRSEYIKKSSYFLKLPFRVLPRKSPSPTKAEMKKREFYLNVARSVVFGEDSYSSAAKRFGVEKSNVCIWVNLFLTHGEDIFRHSRPKLQNNRAINCAYYHLAYKRTIAETASWYLIFSHNQIKHYIRRYRKFILPSKKLIHPGKIRPYFSYPIRYNN